MHKGYGKFKCIECLEVEENPDMINLTEDSTLIYCNNCHKWVRWN